MGAELSQAWDERIGRLLTKLPKWLRSLVEWLRVPSHWWIRLPAALLFILGGVLSVLPVLGLWMLPLGFALLAEDVPGMKTPLEKIARWSVRTFRRLRGGA